MKNTKNLVLHVLAAVFVLLCLSIDYRALVKTSVHLQKGGLVIALSRRGTIYDRSGHELARSVMGDSALAVPSEVKDIPSTVGLITRITGEDPRFLLALCRAHTPYCWVARKADDNAIERISSLNLQGIHFQKESKRFYPAGDLAIQVLGSVGMEDSGQSGIEQEFDTELRGRPGAMSAHVTVGKYLSSDSETQPEPGRSIILTIDKNIQQITEKELDQAIHDTQAVSGSVIVMNPHTGEILALANRPTFNPNVRREMSFELLKNSVVSDFYEPGSMFKLVAVSAGLEEKVTRPDEMFDCQMGSIVINGIRIHETKPHGMLSVADIVAESSDVGAIKVALRLGDDRFYKYIRAFGFGQPTGIELPDETHGITKPPERWSSVSLAAISMGQEIGISAVQLASFVSTIANDGVRVPPRIVAGTISSQGAPETIAFRPAEGTRVISALTAMEMRQMLQSAVVEGTGRRAMIEGYSAAGKTGTAQEVDLATHAYSKTQYVASFAGFAPVNNPAIVIEVVLDSPVGLHQGGQVSAPVFSHIAQQVLKYLRVPHDLPPVQHRLLAKDKDLEEGTPDHPGASLETAEDNAALSGAIQ